MTKLGSSAEPYEIYLFHTMKDSQKKYSKKLVLSQEQLDDFDYKFK